MNELMNQFETISQRFICIVEYQCEKTLMVSNDRSLTNQKDELGNSLNPTNQDFYVCPVDKKTKKTMASLQAVPSF